MLGLAVAITGMLGFAVALQRGVANLRMRRTCDVFLQNRARYADETYDFVPLTFGPRKERLDRHDANGGLAALGYRQVGDRIDPREGREASDHRLLLSAEGTIIAFFHADVPNVYLESVTATDEYVTGHGHREFVALPPTHHRQWVDTASLRKLIAAHQQLLASRNGELVTFASVEEIDVRFKEAWERLVRWRNSHGDDELLDLDLRVFFGNDAATIARVRHLFVATPPAARVHRRTKA